MIVVSLNGRLGNQLFQYAFALALSSKLQTFYLIDSKNAKDSVRRYFTTIRLTDREILRQVLNRYYQVKKLDRVEQTGFEPVESIRAYLSDNRYYDGFFQSIEYISNDAPYFKKMFRLKKKHIIEFQKKYGKLFKEHKIIALHYRLGDYLDWGGESLGGKNMTLPETYYANALNLIPNLEEYLLIVVTDDYPNARSKLSFVEKKLIISDKEILDFQILMNAHKVVVSNSTFSWWAAFLNTNEAQIFAPEHWLGFKVQIEYPVNIIPPQFIKVPFTTINKI